jgi:uncharacterized protein YbaR (Trm112 family)
MSGQSPQSDSSNRAKLLASIVDQLACPACHAALRMDATALLCTACGRIYPIIDGIPVLIAEEPERE